MAFVVVIVTCLGRELLRTVVRTEPEWTYDDLFAYTSQHQNTSGSEVFSLVDVCYRFRAKLAATCGSY